MIGGLTALIFLSTLHVLQTLKVHHQISLTETKVGDNVTLTCGPLGPEKSLFYWYKMNFGDNIQTIFQGTFHHIRPKGQFENLRFYFKKVGDFYFFEIRNISKEDEGTYFCQAGVAYAMEFIDVTFLAVNGPQMMSKTENGMKPNSDLESVPLGSSVNLSCRSKYNEKSDQCPGEQTVYWYRAGSASHPGAVYKSRVVCEDPGRRSCSYHLSKTIQNSLDAGLYYCAVLACGEILFGGKTKVEITSTLWDLQEANIFLYLICGAFTTSLIVASILVSTVKKKTSGCCNDALRTGDEQQIQKRYEDHVFYSVAVYSRKEAGGADRRHVWTTQEEVYTDVSFWDK